MPEVVEVLEGIVRERGIPRNIKGAIEELMGVLEKRDFVEDKVSYVISVLDEVVDDPNLSQAARLQIWNAVSVLEGLKAASL